MADYVGTDGPDIFVGTDADDTANGNGGDDRLIGNGGTDRLQGGAGADRLEGGPGTNFLASYQFDPLAPFPTTYVPNMKSIDTFLEADTLIGGDDSDYLFAGYGDTVTGGGGTDYLYYNFLNAPSGVNADFRLAASGSLTIGGGVISGIEVTRYVEGSNFADTIYSLGEGSLYGNDGDDSITAASSDILLSGGAGNDLLNGLAMQQGEIDGDEGNDTISALQTRFIKVYAGAGDDVINGGYLVHAGTGNDQITTSIVAYGEEGNDQLTSTASNVANFFFGGLDADVIHGGGGDDLLGSADASSNDYFSTSQLAAADDLGTAHDQLFGESGNDRLAIGYGDDADGGTGTDTLLLSLGGAPAGVTLNTDPLVHSGSVVIGGGTVQNMESITRLFGSAFGDTITVADQTAPLSVDLWTGDDVISWGTTALNVKGGAGNDFFVNGSAIDTIDGGDGIDTLDYRNATVGVTMYFNPVRGGVGGATDGDLFYNIENVNGSAFNDSIDGGFGANVLNGMAGADTLNGGTGNDVLRGGAGDDTIIGGVGLDTAIFSGNASSYSIASLGNGRWQVSGPDGVDQVSGVERLQFDDHYAELRGNAFDSASLASGNFGHSASAGSWTSNTLYPRMAADVNGDGRADLVGFGANGVTVSLANGSGGFITPYLANSGFGSSTAAGGWTSNDLYPRMVAKITYGYNADIVAFKNDGVHVSIGMTGEDHLVLASFGTAAGGWSSQTTYPRMMADVNGDGLADVVGFASSGVVVALSDAQGGFGNPYLALAGFGAAASAGGWSDSNAYPRMMADINGDGRADVVGFGYNGVYAALSDGHGFGPAYLAFSGFGASSSAGGWNDNTHYPRMMADMNGDGMADIVGFGNDGMFIATADGTGHFGTITLGLAGFGTSAAGGNWTSNDLYPRVIADTNGDGLGDVIGFGEAGVYVQPSVEGHWVFV